MIRICKNCETCHDCSCKARASSDKSVSKRTGNVVALRESFELNISKVFFYDYRKTGSTNRAKFIGHGHNKMAVKWVSGTHDCNFSKHMKYNRTAADIMSSMLSDFTDHVDMRGWEILAVKPLIPDGPKEIALEPYVGKVAKFNTNSLWETDASRTYQRLLLALSHFSYVASKGKFVLMNIRGGVDERKKVVMLLPPTVVSTVPGKYGCRDLGIAGRFFKYHSCNSFCRGMPKNGDGCRKRETKFVEW